MSASKQYFVVSGFSGDDSHWPVLQSHGGLMMWR